MFKKKAIPQERFLFCLLEKESSAHSELSAKLRTVSVRAITIIHLLFGLKRLGEPVLHLAHSSLLPRSTRKSAAADLTAQRSALLSSGSIDTAQHSCCRTHRLRLSVLCLRAQFWHNRSHAGRTRRGTCNNHIFGNISAWIARPSEERR